MSKMSSAKAVVSTLFLLAGPVSLAVYAMPWTVVTALWAIGLVAGLLLAPRDQAVAVLGFGIAMLGPDITVEHFQNGTPDLVFPFWQPIIVTFSGVVVAYYGSRYFAGVWRKRKA